jgi:hypothetical protein
MIKSDLTLLDIFTYRTHIDYDNVFFIDCSNS